MEYSGHDGSQRCNLIVMVAKGLNRQCLQRPRPQTRLFEALGGRIRVRAALYDPENPLKANQYESGRKLRAWVIRDEQEIERRFERMAG